MSETNYLGFRNYVGRGLATLSLIALAHFGSGCATTYRAPHTNPDNIVEKAFDIANDPSLQISDAMLGIKKVPQVNTSPSSTNASLSPTNYIPDTPLKPYFEKNRKAELKLLETLRKEDAKEKTNGQGVYINNTRIPTKPEPLKLMVSTNQPIYDSSDGQTNCHTAKGANSKVPVFKVEQKSRKYNVRPAKQVHTNAPVASNDSTNNAVVPAIVPSKVAERVEPSKLRELVLTDILLGDDSDYKNGLRYTSSYPEEFLWGASRPFHLYNIKDGKTEILPFLTRPLKAGGILSPLNPIAWKQDASLTAGVLLDEILAIVAFSMGGGNNGDADSGSHVQYQTRKEEHHDNGGIDGGDSGGNGGGY